MNTITHLPRSFFRILSQRGPKAVVVASYKFFRYAGEELTYRLLLTYYARRHAELAVKRVHGRKMYLKVTDIGLSKQLLLYGTRERMQTRLVKQLLKPGMVTLEIGANLGYYALIEAPIVGQSGQIYAIEPVPENYDILCRNVRLNGYEDRTQLYCCAVSDNCGSSEIALTAASNCATMFFDHPEKADYQDRILKSSIADILKVKTTTVDAFLKDKRQVDFIRMDVEGYEIVIVKGMMGTLKSAKIGTAVFLELHPTLFKRTYSAVEEILSSFSQSGFEVTHIVDGSGTRLLNFSRDDVLKTIRGQGDTALGLFFQKEHTAATAQHNLINSQMPLPGASENLLTAK